MLRMRVVFAVLAALWAAPAVAQTPTALDVATISMTNATTPKLVSNNVCATDGNDLVCDRDVTLLTGGLMRANYIGIGTDPTTTNSLAIDASTSSGNDLVITQPNAATGGWPTFQMVNYQGGSAGSYPQMLFMNSTGTSSSAGVMQAGGPLAQLSFWGRYPSGMNLAARIVVVTEEQFSVSGTGTAFRFDTVAASSTGLSEKMRLTGRGELGLGYTVPSTTLHIKGSIRLASETSTTLGVCDSNRTGAIRYTGGDFSFCRNGSAWETMASVAGGGDRIASGTTSAVVNSTTTYISLTTSGSTWGYFGSVDSYLPKITTAQVSATTISTTAIQIFSPTTALTCSSSTAGTIRYNSPTTTLELCTGSGWQPMGVGVPAGTISAFASTTCPTGWSEYTAARGRFLRGIDNGAGNDPSGTRTPGDVQADAIKSHWLREYIRNGAANTSGGGYRALLDSSSNYALAGLATNFSIDNTIQYIGAAETRPTNVAITYCQFNGTSNGWNNPLSGGSTTAAGSTGQLQYNTGNAFDASAGLTWTNASSLLTVAGRISATNISVTALTVNGVAITGSGGASKLASMTDVTTTGVVSGSVLAFNAATSSWTALPIQQVMSTTTMTANFPDAILCGGLTAYLNVLSAGIQYYRVIANTAGDQYIGYTAAGAYSTHLGMGSTDCVTGSKSIATLYAEGKAFNFIGTANASGSTALGDRITSGTTAVTVNSATSTISFTVANTTTGYMNSSGLLVLPGISATTNNSSFTTGFFSGKVGLGYTTPSQTLDIKGGLRVGSTAAYTTDYITLSIGDSAVPVGVASIGFNPTSQSNQGYSFESDGATFSIKSNYDARKMLTVYQSGVVGVLTNTATPTTALHVSGSLRIADGGEACDANRAGAIRYTSASIFQTCNGGGTWTAIGSGTGASRLASLTDVSLSNVTSMDVLRYNGVSWTNVNVQNAISTTTMAAGWPDAINCGGNYFYPVSPQVYRLQYQSTSLDFLFNSDGSYNYYRENGGGSIAPPAYWSACVNRSIAQYYALGAAYNFIGGQGQGTDRIVSGTSSIVINSATSTISFTVANTTTGYMNSAGLLVVPGISITTLNGISSTNGYFSGSVGIGVSNTAVSLTVAGQELRVQHDSAFYSFYNSAGTSRNGYLQITSGFGDLVVSNSAPLRFWTNNTVRMRINSDGNIGIGTGTVVPSTSLHVSGTLRIADGGEACDVNRAGAIRYTSASTFQTCNGGGTWTAIGSGTGASRLASLTDVSVGGAASGSVLVYNGATTSWTALSIQQVMSTSTMTNGWPDAIRCNVTSPNAGPAVFYQVWAPYSTGLYYYANNGFASGSMYVVFNSNGTFNSYNSGNSGASLTTTDCNTTISSLYSSGQAFNFIGTSNTSNSTALGDRITSGTTSALVNSATTYISLTTGATTWGYLSSGTTYLPNIFTLNVSATGVSVTTLQLNGQAGGAGLTLSAASSASTALGDRIVSTSANIVAYAGGTISFTTGGTSGTAYLDTVGRFVTPGISTTSTISTTNVYMNLSGGTCASSADEGRMFRNPTTKRMQMCVVY